MIAPRRSTCHTSRSRNTPAAILFPSDKHRLSPTIQTNDGNTTSVIVQPFQSACRSGPYASLKPPAVLTRIIRAIIGLRNASSETRRSGFAPGEPAEETPRTLLACAMGNHHIGTALNARAGPSAATPRLSRPLAESRGRKPLDEVVILPRKLPKLASS